MANLLNVTPQVPSNKTSPSVDSSFSGLKNPAKLQESELKNIFDRQLSSQIDASVSENQTNEVLADFSKKMEKEQDEMAAANGLIVPMKATIADLPMKAAVATASEQKGVREAAASEVSGRDLKMQLVQNQLKTASPIQQAANLELVAANSGEDLSALQGEFDIESLDVQNSESESATPKASTSKLSTSDFLNLREISQNLPKANSVKAANDAVSDPLKMAPLPSATAIVMGMKPTQQKQKDTDGKEDLTAAMSGLAPAHSDQKVFSHQLEATVSQAAGQKPVLSPETMTQIGNQVNLLGQARQDGEIKIRLRPDHLGELQMSVRTQGQQVSVQIKAENNEAKKIIEDSLSSLREHLSQQNLSLARIDVVTQPSATADQAPMNFDANQNFNQSFSGDDRGARDGSGQSRRETMRDENVFGGAPTASMIRPRTSSSSTRLDLIA